MDKEFKEFDGKLAETSAKLKQDLAVLRTNRPTTKLVEDIKVDYYGQMMPVKALGTIGINPPREITISVWDKNALGPVSKAIQDSGLGMTPNTEGNMIRLNFPSLTDERKQEMVKLVKKTTEEAKIKIRLLRDDVMKELKTAEEKKEIGEGEKFKLKEKVQKIVDKHNGEIETML